MLILGVHLGHDASICLLEDGFLKKYFLVERFTRKKHDDNDGVILDLVSGIASKLKKKLDVICVSNFNYPDQLISTLFKTCAEYNPKVKLILQQDHHFNHASLAFYNSKFDDSLVIVVDGVGSRVKDNLLEVESIFYFYGRKKILLYKNLIKNVLSSEFSNQEFLKMWTTNDNPSEKVLNCQCKNIFGIGSVYNIAAILIGNTPHDCGKAMGLSSYGSSNDLFKNLFLKKNTLNNNFFKNSPRQVQNFLTSPVKEINEYDYKLHADFCYEVQQQTQKAVGDLIEGCVKKTGIKRVCISGGYGMNVVANQYYVQRFPDVEFYFEPLCNDNGISIGAAMNAYIQLEDKVPKPIKDTFTHGSYYDISSYKGVRTSVKEIANLLNENKSVAVYKGLAESGQRALGNRSILFNALNVDAKEIVNRIKKREWYRPFACIVLEEDANIYFDMGRIKKSPYMTMCFPVKSDMIPGVTHVDGTCRVQTVSSGHLYDILKAFKNLTGHGILLNTSLNLAGEPLAETPKDAFDTLNNSSLDYLWFEETKQLFEK